MQNDRNVHINVGTLCSGTIHRGDQGSHNIRTGTHRFGTSQDPTVRSTVIPGCVHSGTHHKGFISYSAYVREIPVLGQRSLNAIGQDLCLSANSVRAPGVLSRVHQAHDLLKNIGLWRVLQYRFVIPPPSPVTMSLLKISKIFHLKGL